MIALELLKMDLLFPLFYTRSSNDVLQSKMDVCLHIHDVLDPISIHQYSSLLENIASISRNTHRNYRNNHSNYPIHN